MRRNPTTSLTQSLNPVAEDERTADTSVRELWADAGVTVDRVDGWEMSTPTRLRRSTSMGSTIDSIRDLASAATGDILGSSSSGVRDFEHSYGSLIRLSRFVLCLPAHEKADHSPQARPGAGRMAGWKLRLLFLWALLGAHAVVCVAGFVVSFVDIGFGSVGMTNMTDTTSVLKAVTSFDFSSQLMALLTGLLCAWWFFCTREYAKQMLRESDVLRVSPARRSGGFLRSTDFGWDFFLSYPGASTSVEDATPRQRGPEDASLFAEELRKHVQQMVDHSGIRYPTGVFLDKDQIPRELAMLHEKSRSMGGPACPPGPRTGFHIFISYRRRNAADARALKQALAQYGYRIFMDLDPDGLQSGDFQKQLERVLDDVPVVLMHCSKDPPGEFARIANDNDWVRLEIRKTLEAKKLLIPVVASGQLADIGEWGFRHLPEDCRDLQRLNATDLNDGQYEASVLKVHKQIEAEAEKLAQQTALLGQQDKAVTDHWMQHFRSHLEQSSVIVIIVTTSAIETIRNPDQNRLAATKLLLEWGHALLLASQHQQQEGWAELDQQPVIVVPIFLTGHQGDRKPHPDTPERYKLDFANFDSVEKLVERVLGSGTTSGPADPGRLTTTMTGQAWDREGFWEQFSDEEPEWFTQQLLQTFSTGGDSQQEQRLSVRFGGVAQKVDPRSTVKGIFNLARRNGFLLNIGADTISSVQTPGYGLDGSIARDDLGNLISVSHRRIIQVDESRIDIVSKQLMETHRACRNKEHICFADELQQPGRRIQLIHGLLVFEARARDGDAEEVFEDDRYDCIGRAKDQKLVQKPLTDAAVACEAQVTRGKIVFPVVAAVATTWSVLTYLDLLAYNDYLECLVDVTRDDCAKADTAELTKQLPETQMWVYAAFLTIETIGFVVVLFPLALINSVFFRLDSKFTTALGRRFIAKLSSPAARLPTDQLFHYEYDNVLTATSSLNFDWGFQLPLLLMLPTLICTVLWYRVWYQPCAFTMMPSELCADDIACSTFCDQVCMAHWHLFTRHPFAHTHLISPCADQDDPTTPTALSSSSAFHILLPLVATGIFLLIIWPLMDFQGRYHVSMGARIQATIQGCSHDQLRHLQGSGGRPQIASYVHSMAPRMQLFGVALSPVGARFFCVAWLTILLTPFINGAL